MMAKAKIRVELEIEFDELQYENDGFIGPENVKDCFLDEFKPKTEHIIGFDFEFRVINSDAILTEFKPSEILAQDE
jgi:hypothetical protein